jgi:hypothetical protein
LELKQLSLPAVLAKLAYERNGRNMRQLGLKLKQQRGLCRYQVNRKSLLRVLLASVRVRKGRHLPLLSKGAAADIFRKPPRIFLIFGCDSQLVPFQNDSSSRISRTKKNTAKGADICSLIRCFRG